MNKLKITPFNQQKTFTDFFDSEYITFASYDSIRKIASLIDGLKPTARKIVYTAIELKLTELKKVDSIKSKVADFTEYIHGQDSIEGVIINLAQNFIGTKNIPLLRRDGAFGTRLIPDAAASRYIRTAQELYLKNIFIDDDKQIIGNQLFEGSKIEPKFYVPIIPLLAINGSEGIAVGYAQKILPRKLDDVMDYIFNKSSDIDLIPYYEGFKGTVVHVGENSIEIHGKIENINTTTYRITEVPIGYSYTSYKKVLDKMEESNLISSYEDLCNMNTDTFIFNIKVKRELHAKLNKMSKYKLLDYFKLIKRISENFTCIDENNQIVVYNSIKQIIDKYKKIRLEYYKKRKIYILSKMQEQIDEFTSKIAFIDGVRCNRIDIKGESKKNLIEILDKNDIMVLKNNSYDYLLNMPLWSINTDTFKKTILLLKQLIKDKEVYEKTSELSIWKKVINILLELIMQKKIQNLILVIKCITHLIIFRPICLQ